MATVTAIALENRLNVALKRNFLRWWWRWRWGRLDIGNRLTSHILTRIKCQHTDDAKTQYNKKFPHRFSFTDE